MAKTIKEKIALINYIAHNSNNVAIQIGRHIVALFDLERKDNHKGVDRFETKYGPKSAVDIAKMLLLAFEKFDHRRGKSSYSEIGDKIADLFAWKQLVGANVTVITSQGVKPIVELEDIAGKIILDATQDVVAEIDSLLGCYKVKRIEETEEVDDDRSSLTV